MALGVSGFRVSVFECCRIFAGVCEGASSVESTSFVLDFRAWDFSFGVYHYDVRLLLLLPLLLLLLLLPLLLRLLLLLLLHYHYHDHDYDHYQYHYHYHDDDDNYYSSCC